MSVEEQAVGESLRQWLLALARSALVVLKLALPWLACASGLACAASPSCGPGGSGDPAVTWAGARAGDYVEYRLQADVDPVGSPAGRKRTVLALRAEVEAVEGARVWVRLSVRDARGAALSYAPVARDLLVPVDVDPNRQAPAPARGSSRTIAAAGSNWRCTYQRTDDRPRDGNLTERWTVPAGALYLAEGLVRQAVSFSGEGAKGGYDLVLTGTGRGAEGASGAVPSDLPALFPPGAWYDEIRLTGNLLELRRTSLAAVNGRLRRTTATYREGEDAPVTESVEVEGRRLVRTANAEVFEQPLIERFLDLAWAEIDRYWEGFLAAAAPDAEAVALPRGAVRARVVRNTFPYSGNDVKNGNAVESVWYAADPWDPALEGLPYEARFRPIRRVVEVPGERGYPWVESLRDWEPRERP